MRRTFWLVVLLFPILSMAATPPQASKQVIEKRQALLIERLKTTLPGYAEPIVQDERFKIDPALIPKFPVRTGPRQPSYQYLFVEWAFTRGAEFLKQNEIALNAAEKQYGVSREVIAGIFGIETQFGKGTGRSPVLKTLYTLAILGRTEKKRAWAANELIIFLELSRRNEWDPFAMKGSYTGALGRVQFEPSSYWNDAVQYEDGRCVASDLEGHAPDLFSDPDAICSAANYLRKHGWGASKEAQRKAVFAYNHEHAYVNAVLAYAAAVYVEPGPKRDALVAKLRLPKKAARR